VRLNQQGKAAPAGGPYGEDEEEEEEDTRDRLAGLQPEEDEEEEDDDQIETFERALVAQREDEDEDEDSDNLGDEVEVRPWNPNLPPSDSSFGQIVRDSSHYSEEDPQQGRFGF